MAKKKKQQDKRDAQIRATNRLAEKQCELGVSVENLQWKQKRIEKETLKMKVENAREKARRKGQNNLTRVVKMVTPPKTEMPPRYSTIVADNGITNWSVTPTPPVIFPHPSFSLANSCNTLYLPPMSPDNSAINFISPRPLSEAEHTSNWFQFPYYPTPSPSPTPSSSSYKPVCVKPQCPKTVPTYTPTPLTKAQKKAQNPIKFVTDRPFSYWNKMRDNITRQTKYGKRLYQNPADGLWFDIFHYDLGGVRVRIGTDWHALAYSDEHQKM